MTLHDRRNQRYRISPNFGKCYKILDQPQHRRFNDETKFQKKVPNGLSKIKSDDLVCLFIIIRYCNFLKFGLNRFCH